MTEKQPEVSMPGVRDGLWSSTGSAETPDKIKTECRREEQEGWRQISQAAQILARKLKEADSSQEVGDGKYYFRPSYITH